MNILYCCDDHYAPLAGISMTSLFENNKEFNELTVNVAVLDISDENRDKLIKTGEKYGREVVIIDGTDVNTFLVGTGVRLWKGNCITWWRLFISQLLPDVCGKVLYLDCDTILVGNLSKITDFRFLEGKACAAVREGAFYGHRSLIGIDEEAPYYVAGVMLFDIDKWREYEIESKVAALLDEGYGEYPYVDQDFISVHLADYIQTMTPDYCVNALWELYGANNYCYTRSLKQSNFYSEEELEHALNNRKILHCVMILRTSGVPGCFEPEWLQYREMSLWEDAYENRKGVFAFSLYIGKILYRVLPKSIYFMVAKWQGERSVKKQKKGYRINEQIN